MVGVGFVNQNARRWERLEELFAAAVDLPADRQAVFVDRETAGDAELRRQLLALLRYDAGAGERIHQAVGVAARAATSQLDWVGRRFGPYRVVREIGRGGMGLVFEAVRADDEYRKRVALKIALGWRDLDLLGERLRHERQILASLEHPNIARFLDGGTENGIPYFAMEYVEGRPIGEYSAQRHLKLRDRLELFRDVCAAVEYAHQNLVVHRDLKPRNVLVNEEGVPKLLDFGIAKLLLSADESAANTLGGFAPWTPDYASPEQVRGQPVTTRTDVYSLGLLLFELLTSERGQVADTASPLALDRSICEREAPRASECAARRGDRALARQLRGDLDTIVAMALRKEPERRYASVAALSEDLGRHLRGVPVIARPGTFWYRVGKLLRRHRLAVASAAVITLSLAGGVAATLHEARRAERRFQQVRKLADSVLFEMQDRLQNLTGATETREWAVRTALEYLDDLAKDAGQDKSVLVELAAGYLKIGDVQGYPLSPSLGHRDAALVSYSKALGIAERLAVKDSDPQVRQLLARCHQRIGAILRATRRTTAAIEEYQRALAIAEPLSQANPSDPDDASLLTIILNTLGQAQSAAGNTAEASRLWMRTLLVASRSTAEHPPDQTQSQLAATEKTVIRAQMYAGDLEGAEKTALEGIHIREVVSAAEPANSSFRRNLMNSFGDAAYVYFHPAYLSLGDRRAAAALQKKALSIARELAAADPSNMTAQADLQITEADLCAALSEDDPAAALGHCRASVTISQRWSGQINAEAALAYMSDALHHLGRNPEALQALRSAIELRQELYRDDPGHFANRQQLLRGYNQMAALLFDLGEEDGAREQYRQALGLAEELAAAIPTNLLARRDLADTYEGLGKSFERRDDAQARIWYQKSLGIWTAWPRFAHSGRMDEARRRNVELALLRCGGTVPPH